MRRIIPVLLVIGLAGAGPLNSDDDRTEAIRDLRQRVTALEELEPVSGPPGPDGPPGPPGKAMEADPPGTFPWLLLGGAVLGLGAGVAYAWKKQG